MPEAQKHKSTIALEQLFSEGTLEQKAQQALEVSEMPEIRRFVLEVPWRIELQQGKTINGLSETMRLATKDIHSQLHTLLKTFPPESRVTVALDERKLSRQQLPRSSGERGGIG